MFDHMTQFTTLVTAWNKVKGNRGAPGGDGISIRDYEAELEFNLLRLQRDLKSGHYRPGPMRRLSIPKPQGGKRPLSIPCVVDRIAQSAALEVLGPLLDQEMEDSSFAYRPGRSVRMAVDRVAALRRAGYTWVVDGDIERYFENIHHDKLLKRVRRSVTDEGVIGLIDLWLKSFAPEGKGVPQGAPISPLLSNLFLDDIDEAIEGQGVRLVRFADDFVLLCKREQTAERAKEKMAALLMQHGLRLHPEKTKIVPFEQEFRFLGKLFIRSIMLDEMRETPNEPERLPPCSSTIVARTHGSYLHPGSKDAAAPALSEQPPTNYEYEDTAIRKDLSPFLRVLYVHERGRRVDLRNSAFSVQDRDLVPTQNGESHHSHSEVLAIPSVRVDRIELGPEVDITTRALRLAMDMNIPVSFVNGWGQDQGTCAPPMADRTKLHLEQARHTLNIGLRTDLARRIVAGKLHNQRALLRRLNRRRKIEHTSEAAGQIGRIRRKLDLCQSVPQLMGIEGEAAALYWPALGNMLEHGWQFDLRRRQPPSDPVNLVISWLSSMMVRDINALIERHGLHTGMSVLHSVSNGRQSLALDLAEEFRAPLCESLAIYLFNNRILDTDMFSTLDDGSPHIGRVGGDRVIRHYEDWLDRNVKSPSSEKTTTWRGIMNEQVMGLVRHVQDNIPYVPYAMDY